jgi:signal transduction histidine kinase
VERHGGEVWCESDDRPGTPGPGTPGPGTRFSMRLPSGPDPEEPEPPGGSEKPDAV